MAIPIKLDGITVKIESVYGTDPVPTIADNAVRIADRLWPNLRVEHAFPVAIWGSHRRRYHRARW
jgi:hypothetical protein